MKVTIDILPETSPSFECWRVTIESESGPIFQPPMIQSVCILTASNGWTINLHDDHTRHTAGVSSDNKRISLRISRLLDSRATFNIRFFSRSREEVETALMEFPGLLQGCLQEMRADSLEEEFFSRSSSR